MVSSSQATRSGGGAVALYKFVKMSKTLFRSEILGLLTQNDREFEVAATAEGDFDEAGSQLTVVLDSFLRVADSHGPERRTRAAWLPGAQTVKAGVSQE